MGNRGRQLLPLYLYTEAQNKARGRFPAENRCTHDRPTSPRADWGRCRKGGGAFF